VHPEVRKFSEAFTLKMKRLNRNVQLNENELRFLDQVFGPEFSYNFQGLTPQMPFTDYTGTDRYIDFHYESGPIRVIIEADSLKHHVTGITLQQYDDHMERQNDMILNGGWILVRFPANMIRRRPMVCRRQLVQAVGKSLINSKLRSIKSKEEIWLQTRMEIIQFIDENGLVKPSDLSRRYGVHIRTARRWLQRMVKEGDLIAQRGKRVVIGYKLTPNDDESH